MFYSELDNHNEIDNIPHMKSAELKKVIVHYEEKNHRQQQWLRHLYDVVKQKLKICKQTSGYFFFFNDDRFSN